MKVPADVMQRMRELLWRLAEEADWNQLTDVDKGTYYRNWVADPKIGGVLSQYIGVNAVKTYIKDAVLKVYARRSREDAKTPLIKIGLNPASKIAQRYIKPHGIKLVDGKIVCWGRSKQWKSVLMALHERSFADVDSVPYGAVLLEASDGFGDNAARAVVVAAATKLGIRKVVWV